MPTRYETELIDRAMSVLEAASGKHEAQTIYVRLALWVLRPYCSQGALAKYWTWCKPINPTLVGDLRGDALRLIREELTIPRQNPNSAE